MIRRRIERQREQLLLALRGLCDGFCLRKGSKEIVSHKDFNAVHGHMVIVARIEQMQGRLCAKNRACCLRGSRGFP